MIGEMMIWSTVVEIRIDQKILEKDLCRIDNTLSGLEDVTAIIPKDVWEEIDRMVLGFLAQRFEEIKSIPLSERTLQIKEEFKRLQTPVEVWADGGVATSPPNIPSGWAGRFTNTLYEAVINSRGFGEQSRGFHKELDSDPNMINAFAEWSVDVEAFYMVYPALFNSWLKSKDPQGMGLLFLSETQQDQLASTLLSAIIQRIDFFLFSAS